MLFINLRLKLNTRSPNSEVYLNFCDLCTHYENFDVNGRGTDEIKIKKASNLLLATMQCNDNS